MNKEEVFIGPKFQTNLCENLSATNVHKCEKDPRTIKTNADWIRLRSLLLGTKWTHKTLSAKGRRH